MAARGTAAHTAAARAAAGQQAGEGGVAAGLGPGGFLGLPAPFGAEGNGRLGRRLGREALQADPGPAAG